MKKLTIKLLSFILILSMTFSMDVTVFASNASDVVPSDALAISQKTYLDLNDEAKSIFEKELAKDLVLQGFHKAYIDEDYNAPSSIPYRLNAAAAANPMSILSAELIALNLPTAVRYALTAIGSGMVAAGVDGPLPIGNIIGVFLALGGVAVIAANWDVVAPKWNGIVKAFKKTFSESARSISTAFAKIKKQVEDKVKGKDKNEKPTGNRVKDVHKRLKKEGFTKQRQAGSHETWVKGNRTVEVPNHGENHEIPIGTLRNILCYTF